MDTNACSVPWGGLIVVLACIAIVSLTYMSLAAARVASQRKWSAEWRRWRQSVAEQSEVDFLRHLVQRGHADAAVRRSKHV